MKRVNGHTVGTKMDDGAPRWVVRVKHEGHPLDGQKLKVVGKPGNLSKALDVDFLIVHSNSLPVAADVLPRGVVSAQTERTTSMIRSTGMKIALCAVAALVAISMFPYAVMHSNVKSLKSAVLEVRVGDAVRKLQSNSFADLVTNEVVAQAVATRGYGTYTAREAFIDAHLCPAFGDYMRDYGTRKTGNRNCWHAMYDAQLLHSEEALERDNLPRAIDAPLKIFRSTMIAVGRKYLANPGRLRSFYEGRRKVGLASFKLLDEETQKWKIEDTKAARHAFETYVSDSAVRELLADHLKLEKLWLEADSDAPERTTSYEAWEESRKLIGTYADINWLQFAARRHADGGELGNELVREYVWIADDMLKQVGASN